MPICPPFRLAPYFRTRVWGFHDLSPWYQYKTDGEPIGEVWLTGEMCNVSTGPLAGLSLTDATRQHSADILGSALAGQEFPLLIKILFPKEKLSVQVHPDDVLAQKYGEPRGKTECWYALDAQPGAEVALGIRSGVTPEQVRRSIYDATLENMLEMMPVHKGDMLFVDAGTVHAMGPGVVILETQQTSDLTYRMYDYGRPRELHLEKSFEAMQFSTRAGKIASQIASDHSVLIDQHYFHIEKWKITTGKIPSALTAPFDHVQILFISEGDVVISGDSFESFSVARLQVVVVPVHSPYWNMETNGPAEIIRIWPPAV
ncbi:class I mannose-6-phosphate isomerase [Acidipila sp. 4G-K13]|uniref:Mannose-6-phosphate isomerase n=2 Tax=Paracidobacterium acidisoli TaxID=2303751 RepID=A0A372IIY7_9BACT|nr:class I mannose-6-phosphate isomerase [Paracidobacterium acidisoli]